MNDVAYGTVGVLAFNDTPFQNEPVFLLVLIYSEGHLKKTFFFFTFGIFWSNQPSNKHFVSMHRVYVTVTLLRLSYIYARTALPCDKPCMQLKLSIRPELSRSALLRRVSLAHRKKKNNYNNKKQSVGWLKRVQVSNMCNRHVDAFFVSDAKPSCHRCGLSFQYCGDLCVIRIYRRFIYLIPALSRCRFATSDRPQRGARVVACKNALQRLSRGFEFSFHAVCLLFCAPEFASYTYTNLALAQ